MVAESFSSPMHVNHTFENAGFDTEETIDCSAHSSWDTTDAQWYGGGEMVTIVDENSETICYECIDSYSTSPWCKLAGYKPGVPHGPWRQCWEIIGDL